MSYTRLYNIILQYIVIRYTKNIYISYIYTYLKQYYMYIYTCIGWIDYQVTGEKPDLFKYTPPIILNSIIHIIEDNIYNFLCIEFEKQYIKAFKYYVLIEKDKQQSQQQLQQGQGQQPYQLSIL